jgi:hypothetical protein
MTISIGMERVWLALPKLLIFFENRDCAFLSLASLQFVRNIN